MAGELAIAAQGEGSGLAKVIDSGTSNMVQEIRLQRAGEAERIRRQQEADTKKLASLNKELEQMKIEGWSQDHTDLSGKWTENIDWITNSLKELGPDWDNPSTEAGRKNAIEKRKRMQDLALANAKSKEHKKYFEDALTKFQSGGYTQKSFDEMVKWKNLPLSQREKQPVPVLQKEDIDWRDKYKTNLNRFTNKFSTDKPVDGGDYIQTSAGNYIDKRRLEDHVARTVTNAAGNKTGRALINEAYEELLEDPEYNEGYTPEELQTIAVENAKNNLREYIVSQISTEHTKGLKGGAGSDDPDVVVPQEGKDLTLLKQAGYGGDVKLYNDAGGNLVAYHAKSKQWLKKSGAGWSEVDEEEVDTENIRPVTTKGKTSTLRTWEIKPVKSNISTDYYLDSQGNYHQSATSQTIKNGSIEAIRELEYVEKPNGTISIDEKEVKKGKNVKRGKFAQVSTSKGTLQVPYDAVKNDVEGSGQTVGQSMGFAKTETSEPTYTFGFNKKK